MKLQLVVVETGERWRRALLRMVLDPKTISHNDYGSFHSPGESAIVHHTTIGVSEDSFESAGSQEGNESVDPASRLSADMTRDQRQPLLPLTNGDWKVGGGKSHSPTLEYFDDGVQVLEHRAVSTGAALGAAAPSGADTVLIDLPPPSREKPRFPKEKFKTFMAFLFLLANFVLTTCSLAMVHDWVPDRSTPPLADVFLDHVAPQDWALDASEYLIMVSTNTCVLVVLFHRHKYIIMRRLFTILALLYLMRSITMYVTVLPMSSTSYYCSPKSNSTDAVVVLTRAWHIMTGLGLSVNGKHTYCGDFIYSGHTVMLCMAYLTIAEYSPRRCYLFHWASFCVSFAGIILVLVAHGHYTIDVIIAYYVTTTLFWAYHTLANNPVLKQRGPSNLLARSFWYPLFSYFERNVDGVVPRQYEWPLPWPRRCIGKPSNRNS